METHLSQRYLCWSDLLQLVRPNNHQLVSLTTHRSSLQTSALLAGDENLSTEERKHFCEEILTFAGKSGDPCKCFGC